MISAVARDEGLTDPCSSLVAKSEPRNEEPHECKCKQYLHKVWCPGKGKIHERKFHPDETKAACPDGGAYCASKESELITKVTLNQRNTKDTVVGSVATAHHIEQQKQAHVPDELQRNEQPLPAKTAAVRTAAAEPTTTSTTRDPSDVWVVMAPALWASTDWKCCEHSQGTEDPRIVNMKDTNNLPKARGGLMCRDRAGCGCMFGDRWHSMDKGKSAGTCKVTLAYAMEATGWSIEEFDEYRQRDQDS